MLEAHQETPERESSHWQALVNEVTERLEATSASLAALREAVQRLTLAQPSASEPPANRGVVEPAAVPSAPNAEARSVEPAVSDDEEARREEVRRAVEQARTEMERIWSPEGLASVSEGSWPSRSEEDEVKAEENGHHKAWDEDEMPSIATPDDARLDDVRQAVEAAREDPAGSAEEEPAPAEAIDEDAAREEIRRTLEQFRAERATDASADATSEGSWPSGEAKESGTVGQWPPGDSAWGWPSSATGWPVELDRPAAGEVGEDESATAPIENQAPSDSGAAVQGNDVRDSVRRAVEQARAELITNEQEPAEPEPAASEETAFAWPDHSGDMASDVEHLLIPASLVIEDPQGRIELARVYETLNRLDFASDASLLNYTAHQVTVSLGSSRRAPTAEAVAAAVRGAFGRTCQVTIDGTRIGAQIGDSIARAA
jgi:hypothetical protein